MDAELLEIRDFLDTIPDFALLPAATLQRLPPLLTIRYLRRGSSFPPSGTPQSDVWIVRTGAIDLRDPSEALLDKLGEGDVYAPMSAHPEESSPAEIHGHVVEDALLYVLPHAAAAELRRTHSDFAARMERNAGRVAQRAFARTSGLLPAAETGILMGPVGELLSRAPQTTTPDTSIQQAAQHMSAQGISALLVMEHGRLAGILTDRDLRKRCLATTLSRQEPVRRIMSTRLLTVTRDTPAFEALLTMSRADIHHLPVVEDAESARPVGLISSTDLLRQHGTNSVYLVRDIRNCESLDALQRVMTALPELQIQLVRAGATAHHLGQAITAVISALTRRLLDLGHDQFGPPPVAYAWLACGSQGRREQTAHTDQDNALIHADPDGHPAPAPAPDSASASASAPVSAPAPDAGTGRGTAPGENGRQAHPAQVEDYFRQLAEFVTDGLDACGIRHCPGGVSARESAWRQPLSVWEERFAALLHTPNEKQAMLACHYLDLRVIQGDATLFEPLRQRTVQQLRDQPALLQVMTGNLLKRSPPLGFFRQLVLTHAGAQTDTLDVKKQGLLLISGIAQLFALQAGLAQRHTLERLRGAVAAGVLSAESGANLVDAYETLALLRARHQVDQFKHGVSVDNFVSPKGLSALERSHVKDAFSVIAGVQKTLRGRLAGRGLAG